MAEDLNLSEVVILSINVHIRNSCLCLNALNSLTLTCLSHCAMNTNLCWQGAMVLLFTASGGPPSTHRFFFTNKADTASTHCYSSLLIKSDNTLVTVMLTINHTGRPGNWGADGKTHDECSFLGVSWLVILFVPLSTGCCISKRYCHIIK